MIEETEYVHLTLPPDPKLRPTIGLTLAGLADRAGVGVGGLEDAVRVLEELHAPQETVRYRFAIEEATVTAQVEDEKQGWRTVVELVS